MENNLISSKTEIYEKILIKVMPINLLLAAVSIFIGWKQYQNDRIHALELEDAGNFYGKRFYEYSITEYPMFWIGIILVIVFVAVLFFYFNTPKLTITDKRICGKTVFGKKVDLPIDSITAVASNVFDTLSVSTSSGLISFFGIDNRDEMLEVINNLIIERQQNISSQIIETKQKSIDTPEELIKYKDLLDMGVITQEEFDAKKRQLLGL